MLLHHPLGRALLVVGAVAGFGSGFHSLARHHEHRREDFERHVAQICVDAAQAAQTSRPPQATHVLRPSTRAEPEDL
jgi:hypothetical protein